MRRAVILCTLFLGAMAIADDGFLTIARNALRDGLWAISRHYAEDSQDVEKAREVIYESLAREGKYGELLSKIDENKDALNECEHYWRGWALASLDRDDEAIRDLSYDFKDGERSARARFLKARLLFSLGRDREALKTFDSIPADAVPADMAEEFALFGAMVNDACGNVETAERGFRNLIASAKSNRVFCEAALAILPGEFTNAESAVEARAIAGKVVERAVTADQKLRAGYIIAFIDFDNASKRRDAVTRINDLAHGAPDNPWTKQSVLRLAKLLLTSGMNADALDEFVKYAEMYPADALGDDVLLGKARAFAGLGKHEEAAAAFARLSKATSNPELRIAAILHQADELFALEKYFDAAKLYLEVAGSKVRVAGGEDADFRAGDSFERAGDVNEALAIYKKVAKGKSTLALEAMLRIAGIRSASGSTEEAMKYYDEILAATNLTRDISVRAYLGRGRACYRAYRFEDAARDFNEVGVLDASRLDTMKFLSALCLYGNGRDAEAKTMAKAVLEKTKDAALVGRITLWLAKYDYNRGDWKSAEDGFVRASGLVENINEKCDDLVWAARAAMARNEYAAAISLTTRVSEINATYAGMSEVLLVQGEALYELARFSEAALILSKAAEKSGDEAFRRRVTVKIGDALFMMGSDDDSARTKALAMYREALETGSVSPGEGIVISFKIARTLEKLGKIDQAIEEYYVRVVLAYGEAKAKGVWMDDEAVSSFDRGALALADEYERRKMAGQASNVLRYLAASGTPAAETAGRRLRELEKQGDLR